MQTLSQLWFVDCFFLTVMETQLLSLLCTALLATSRFLEIQWSEREASIKLPLRGKRRRMLHDCEVEWQLFDSLFWKRDRGDDSVGAGNLAGAGDHIHLQCAGANQVLLCTYIDVYRSAQCRSPSLCRRHSILQKKHETIGDKLAFQPNIFDMIFASRLVSLLFVSFLPPTPVDFVRFELLLLRMQRSLPQAPRRCEEDASEELFSKSSSSSEGET